MAVEVQPARAPGVLDEDLPTATARMALDPAENIIEVVAYNAAGLLASPPRQMVVTWDGVASSEPPALHVLAVGVNEYADARPQLKCAVAEARWSMPMAIEVTELASFLDVTVREVSFAALGLRQVPQMSIRGSDFALGSMVSVLDASAESFPATLRHVVEGGTHVLDAPGGAAVLMVESGVFYGVYKIEEKDGFARIAKDGTAFGVGVSGGVNAVAVNPRAFVLFQIVPHQRGDGLRPHVGLLRQMACCTCPHLGRFVLVQLPGAID